MVNDATSLVREILFDGLLAELGCHRPNGARLHVLHVVWVASAPEMAPGLGKLAEEFRATVPVVNRRRARRPLGEIVGYAGRSRIDLIVIGTYGRTGVRALLGGVAERVIRTAPCPVSWTAGQLWEALSQDASHGPRDRLSSRSGHWTKVQ
jgi:nucleotide-binding universal stress UspA family protein